jgi:hypothetical protein
MQMYKKASETEKYFCKFVMLIFLYYLYGFIAMAYFYML